MERPFKRNKKAAYIGGVCAGLAYAIGAPTWLIRTLWFLLFWAAAIGGLVYLVLWVVVPQWPEEPVDYEAVTE